MIDDPSDAIPSRTGDPDPAEYPNASQNPKDWVSGEEPMTEAEAAYLARLCAAAGVGFDQTLTKAAASEQIDQIRARIPGLAGTGGETDR